ncbi:bifunctional 2-C-methyl-D-erythritol 4-phosphate cytidylyltransferase/2-C-methyl-D-erythritol 2,4-cyclodiphosphate synthase [Sphingomonas sp. LaA6.9]|uniref:bifunctional 2-C-methyl-D-erythritol 4-phosphate cytidylyltransferase/2-C-methyl-D-erythritol 2,4-cyclodiphosphate synthase n=1 Tax=Sphingomonas sp. LaA6.9 TaxID=2919914 RepID=UPI001F4F914F|nr:bifunctional 2-C-methyl-D-erythritol 4-phosphate cytidylyltransferase/2-C-methyl-D-erythritol 2,4-cyclodiphosphate synthase [Sphingomonas sp. LaA6.9]MCJ8159810.1 bifunctional 2-C-methyl-D-erythritol 4-phosphate cytidylyltransferase/2-C-methyl-D-erythritol 2,4-cyclodiphosphate synthase [Sphingomonas sp. LaA6.9]
MEAKNHIVALVVAAGRGERAGGAVAKQFAMLAGKPVVAHSVDAFLAHGGIDGVVVVTGADQIGQMQTALGQRQLLGIVEGGATRRESVLAGLQAIEAQGGAFQVLIHDAARPLFPQAVIDRLLAGLDGTAGAVPVLPVADTLAMSDHALGDVVPREQLVRVQTPQAFRFDAILAAHRLWPGGSEATDDAQILRAAELEVAIVEGDPMLEKITQRQDFASAEARLAARASVRTAMGYDVHRLVAGEELWLGGILIPHEKGLSGHSDADVVLHALTDALLGTIGAGDIGMHFPPSDPQWRGVSSDRFLEHAAGLVEQAGGAVEHVDLTIICEAPKIGPYRDAMRIRIAALLRVDIARVSIKATTTERLGFTGRGEGIAAQAIATVRISGDL